MPSVPAGGGLRRELLPRHAAGDGGAGDHAPAREIDPRRGHCGPRQAKRAGRRHEPVLDKRARESWTYYFEEGHFRDSESYLFPSVPVHRQNPGLLFTAKRGSGLDVDSRRIFLFVYFDDGVYDGYLWFSSLPQP